MRFILILLLSCAQICIAQRNSLCIPSLCGNVNISYPFRLRGDPPACGYPDPVFELECLENQAILHSGPRRYHVQAISYTNFSIRISDPGLDSKNYSSCPVYSYLFNEPYSSYMYGDYDANIDITFLNCLRPVSNPLYIQNSFCGNTSAFSNSSRVYSYITVRSISVSELEESCTYDSMVEASSPWPLGDGNYSYSQIHDMLAYGFQLSWFNVMCAECKGSCSLDGGKIVCRNYCDEHAPLSEQDFVCTLEYYGAYLYYAALAIGAIIALRFIVGIPSIIVLVVYKRGRQSEINDLRRGNLINYSYGEINKMTTNLKAKLGEGHRGTVFRGNLRSGPCVAVKILRNSSSTDKEFISYASRISMISHPNVAKLIGFCINGSKRALVYEFLDEELKSKACLSYREMFNISVGIARGIECLHSNQIFHLGIKPENILLDEDLNAKISDSGLSTVYSSDHKIRGMQKMGFIPPELLYKNVGEISSKTDVYSYGMVVLEMGAKLKSLNPYANKERGVYFPRWIYNQMSEGNDLEIEEEGKEMVRKMMIVALWCIQIRPGDRPSMSEVISMLQGSMELLHIPPMPFQKAMDDEEEFTVNR